MYGALLLSLSMAFSSPQFFSNSSVDTTSASNDWPFYGLDFNNRRNPSGVKINKNNVSNLAIKWSYDTVGPIVGNPAIVDGIAYFGDATGFVYAIDAITGALQWQTFLGNPAPLSNPVTQDVFPVIDFPAVFLTPTVKGSKVYVCTFNAYVAVLDKASGALLQTKLLQSDPSFPQGIYSAVGLIKDKDEIIVSLGTFEPQQVGQTDSGAGRIVALKASDINVELWSLATSKNPSNPLTDGGGGVGISGTPAYDKDLNLLYLGTGNNWKAPVTPIADSLLAINPNTGAIDWHVQFTSDDIGAIPNECSPTGVSGKNWDVLMSPILLKGRRPDNTLVDIAVVGQKSGELHAVDRSNGDQLWNIVLTNPNPDGSGFGGINTSGCSDGSVIYVASHYSIDGKPLEANFNVSPRVATGIFAVRAKDGALLWRIDVPSMTVGPLTVANNVLYHTAYDGTLRALDVKDGKALFEFSNSDTTTHKLSGGTTVHDRMVYLPTGTIQEFLPGKLIAFELSAE